MYIEPGDPQLVAITKYTLQLVNHGVGWEFFGIRLTELSAIKWFLEQRFYQLKGILEQRQSQAGFDPIAPCPEIRLMDLITVAIGYVNIAVENETPLPAPPVGGQLALQLGAGVFLIAECFLGGENRGCTFDDSSYS